MAEQAQTPSGRIRGLVELSRVAWILTVLIALIIAILLLLSGYTGYAALSVAVSGAAAINLF